MSLSFHSAKRQSVTTVALDIQQISYVGAYPQHTSPGVPGNLLRCHTTQFAPVLDPSALLNSEYCMTSDSKAGQCANTGQLWNVGGGIRAANRPATTGSRAFSIPI